MKKIYLLMVLLFAIKVSAQIQTDTAAVIIPLFITDGVTIDTLFFGLDPLASDSTDRFLGEDELPPLPPSGVFDARFYFPYSNFNGVVSATWDFRNGTLPYTGTHEYRIKYQRGTSIGGTIIRLSWDLIPQVTGVLKDVQTGGSIVNVSMNGIGSYQVSNPSTLNSLKMFISYDGITPVELVSFSAQAENGKVVLNWKTATEINNLGFTVERSKNKVNWENLGFVNGSGLSNSDRYYSFEDKTVSSSGYYYYRLKQLDHNGEYKYSPVIEVNLSAPASFTLNQNYPNPFNPSTSIGFSLPVSSKIELSIYNLLGEKIAVLLNDYFEAGSHSTEFNAAGLPSGMYIYRLTSESGEISKRMVLMK